MNQQRHEYIAEGIRRLIADYQAVPRWRVLRRLRLLGDAFEVLLEYVAALDAVRCRQINASRRCEGR